MARHDYAGLLSWVVVVIGSIVLHELAHGWAAIKLGDRTPIDLGHMTWNPLVHMGAFSLIMFAILGIAWGAMPVDPSRLRGRHGDALVAIAGPAMNILLAIISVIAAGLWIELAPRAGVEDPLFKNVGMFFIMGGFLNIVLALFNLLPVIPLDGGRIAASYSRAYAEFAMSENGRWIMLGGFLLFFWFAFDPIMAVSTFLVHLGADAVGFVIP